MQRDKIINFLNNYLQVEKFEDHCVNGLQVEGKNEVKKIITGVSFNLELIAKAIDKKADMILVHHGIFGKEFFQLKGFKKERVKDLLTNNISLAGYHLPLDAHPVVGNNILLIKKLGLKVVEKMDIGWFGQYQKPIAFTDFVEKVDQLLKTKSYVLPAGKKQIKTVGIISGGASR